MRNKLEGAGVDSRKLSVANDSSPGERLIRLRVKDSTQVERSG